MPDMASICADLGAEHADLDALVAGLDDSAWDTQTPAEGWTIRDQISHLTYFDERALLAATDPDAFRAWRDSSVAADLMPTDRDPADIALGRSMKPAELLERWRQGRTQLLKALEVHDPKARVPWFGPDMSALSKATARLMETWAHGQDVADALGVQREPSDRLKHICHIGVRALPYAYSIRQMELPSEPLRFEVTSPSGEVWTWGPEDASNVVRGSALDLALVVIQRRHRDDTALEAVGPVADEWLSIAQAFAGPPGPGRPAGMFAKS
jgi:uncharacterized protein (TIGR03084 family)